MSATPPAWQLFSIKAVCTPDATNLDAAEMPARPAPTTTTSLCEGSCCCRARITASSLAVMSADAEARLSKESDATARLAEQILARSNARTRRA